MNGITGEAALSEIIRRVKRSIAAALDGVSVEDGVTLYCIKDAAFSLPDRLKTCTVVTDIGQIREDLNANRAVVIADESLAGRLDRQGFREFVHYVKKPYAEKKMALFYGNCHLERITRYMSHVDAFTEQYAIYPMAPVQSIRDAAYFKTEVLLWCDLFIHQAIRLNNRYGEDFASEKLISRLRSDAQVVAVPNTYHLPMHIFAQYREKKELLFPVCHGTVFFRDGIIDDLCETDHCHIARIVEEYVQDTITIDETIIRDRYQQFIEKVQTREKDWDIKVSDYIEQNFRQKKLYYDPNHPSAEFLIWICKKLLDCLGMDGERADDNAPQMEMDYYEMPVTSAARAALGIEYPEQKLLRSVCKNTLTHRAIDRTEYARQYMALKWEDRELPMRWRVRCFAYMMLHYSLPLLWQIMCITGSRVLPERIKKHLRPAAG